jgi:hypothetical protein
MSKLHSIWTLGMLACALSGAWAQDSTTPPASGSAPQSGQTEPVPAYGQENAPPPVSENPPLSGLDVPSLEPHAAPLSYLQPGATVSESADSNVAGQPGAGAVRSVSRGLGSLTLQRLWSHYDLALDYVGGVAYYNVKGLGFRSLQQMDFDQKITWKRGQMSVRDSFSYLPEGTFGGAYGSLGSQGIASLGNSAFGSFWGGTNLGSLGLAPRVMNVGLVDVSENLTPKSALTAAGGYAFTHFYGEDVSTGATFIGSSQISAQVGYSRLVSAHTQIALVYGYQGFDFSVFGTAFHSHIIQGMYGHRISGRMDLLIAAGPQFTNTALACSISDVAAGNPNCALNGSGQVVGSIPDFRIGAAGQARLRYKFPRTSLDLRFERYETSGSGLFAGAESNIASLSASRPLTRVWSGAIDIGYSRNSRLQSLTSAQTATCVFANQPNPDNLPTCPGVNANTYAFGFAGVAVHRAFGRDFHGFISYQFNELTFDQSYCGGVSLCNRIANRQVGTIGLDWTPRPIRID